MNSSPMDTLSTFPALPLVSKAEALSTCRNAPRPQGFASRGSP
jgi:hypothetical protein